MRRKRQRRSILEVKFDNMHLTDKAGHKFIPDDLVRDVYKNPEILQVRYKTKNDIKRKNKTPVSFQSLFQPIFENFRLNAGWKMAQ